MKTVVNPFLPINEYIADGEPHVFGDRVYLFGSHDKEDGNTFCMLDYVGWSAPVDDLSCWSCSGVIYRASQDPLYDAEKMPYMYAPDVVQGNDGRYYLYYCMSGEKGRGGYSNPISVAVCNEPNGRYEYLGIVRNQDGTPMIQFVCFDPAVINDDGTIRLYYGTWYPFAEYQKFWNKWILNRVQAEMFGRNVKEIKRSSDGIMGAFHVELEDDMLTARSNPVRILQNRVRGTEFEEHPFFEGSSIRKMDDIYYFIYSSLKNHELCYATSRYPDRDFQFRGVIISNGDIGYQGRKPEERLNYTGTNHGGIERIGNQWYVFYHRLTHYSDYSRQACAEKIEVKKDGTIPMVEMTSCGLNSGPLPCKGTYPAVICCNLTDGKMEHGSNRKKKSIHPCVSSRDGQQFIKNIRNNTLIGYKYFLHEGKIRLSVKIRGTAQGIMKILTSENGDSIAEIPLEPSTDWKTYTCDIELYGKIPLYFYYTGSGICDFIEFGFEKI